MLCAHSLARFQRQGEHENEPIACDGRQRELNRNEVKGTHGAVYIASSKTPSRILLSPRAPVPFPTAAIATSLSAAVVNLLFPSASSPTKPAGTSAPTIDA